ncbi:MAG: FAD:protein FMN transferase [Candidatus Eisenbacteria bacterium]
MAVSRNQIPAARVQAEPAGDRRGRRRFLTGLGALGGAALFAPFLTPESGRQLTHAPQRLESSRPGLGTWIRIVAQHEQPGAAERAIGRAFAAIAAVDAQMSVHRADSELSRVNAMAGREAVPVSAALRHVVARARDAALATNGVYDPTVLPLMRLYGFYGSGHAHQPSDRERAAVLASLGARHIVIDDAAGTLGLSKAGAALDLGSIGKGFAVDQAVAALRSHGVRSGLVDVGRNVYALGTPDAGSQGWRIGVLHPETGEVTRVLTLCDEAVATSSNSEHAVVLDGERVGHLLDARAGLPAHARRSATVVARSGIDSDTGSTLAFLLGREGTACLSDVTSVEWLA